MASGIQQLGYVVFEVSELDVWEEFMTKVLGVMLVDRQKDGGFRCRNDEYVHRFIVTPGEADDCVAIGLVMDDVDAAEALRKRLHDADVKTTDGSKDDCAARGVDTLFRFTEPGGNTVEIVTGLATTDDTLVTPLVPSGFVAGDLGFGHVVMRAKDREASERFFCDVVGFNLSDHIVVDLGGYKVDIAFTHVNPRHHSVAFGAGLPKRIHHFLVQVNSIDDLGAAFDRVTDAGLRIVQTIGRHPNDRMISFYAQTPSGFEFEYGYGAREIGEGWEPTTYDHISEWGHRRPPYTRPRK